MRYLTTRGINFGRVASNLPHNFNQNDHRRIKGINLRRLGSSDDSQLLPLSLLPKQEENDIMDGINGDTAQENERGSSTEIQQISSWKQDLNSSVILLTVLSAIGNFLVGYDTGVVSGAMLQIQDDPRINPNTLWTELIVSMTVSLLDSTLGLLI